MRERGQALVLGLFALASLAILAFALVRLGDLMLKRQDLRLRTDLVAFSAGVDYARTLNGLSLSNKALVLAQATGQTVIAQGIQRTQDFAVAVAPAVLRADVVWLGMENGIVAVADLPSLEVRRRYVGERAETFSYTDKSGRTVYVSKDDVRRETYGRKHGRVQSVYRARDGRLASVFVRRNPGFIGIPWDLAETGPHDLVVRGTTLDGAGLAVDARVEAGGGTLDPLVLGGASFEPYFIPLASGPQE